MFLTAEVDTSCNTDYFEYQLRHAGFNVNKNKFEEIYQKQFINLIILN